MKLKNLYTTASLLFVNTVVIFVALNLGAYFVLLVHKHLADVDPVTEKYGEERLRTVYPYLDEKEVQQLLRETWSRPYVYEPFTQFKERAHIGKYVNVDANGYRVSKNQAVWPPHEDEFNVFVFGGSTIFGYGVDDHQTVASYLQQHLRKQTSKKINVYNFGRGFYFSIQERMLFEKLLLEGRVPDMAVFVDGLNDFYHYDGRPLFTDRLSRYVDGGMPKPSFLKKLPIMKLIGEVSDDARLQSKITGEPRYDDPKTLDAVIKRYFQNKKMIEAVASHFGVRTFFVWQPVPTFNYELKNHIFAGKDFAGHKFSHFGYPLMKEHISLHSQGKGFLWAADLQQNLKKPLYVDQVHYTAEFSDILAEFISFNLIRAYPELSN